MKMILSTTALALALGMPSAMLAQTTPAPDAATQSQGSGSQGFLAERGQSDLFASELMGHDVHARRMPADRAATDSQSSTATTEGRAMATVNRAEFDEMDNIGQINENVLSHDGQVRAMN